WLPLHTAKPYSIEGRTLAAIHQVSNKYSGILLRGVLLLNRPDEILIHGKLFSMQFAKINRDLSGGWSEYIPSLSVTWINLPMSGQPFTIHLNHTTGEVSRLIVDEAVQLWEVNMIKGVLSQLQVANDYQQYPSNSKHKSMHRRIPIRDGGFNRTVYTVNEVSYIK
ncbi:hypothetical protein L9F63_022639, partial [Diploptera punctata]